MKSSGLSLRNVSRRIIGDARSKLIIPAGENSETILKGTLSAIACF